MPDLEEQQLSSQDDALILASDGLWDVLSNEDAAGIIRDIKVSPQFPLLHSPAEQPARCSLVGCPGIGVIWPYSTDGGLLQLLYCASVFGSA